MNAITDDDETIRSIMDYFLHEYCGNHISDYQYYNHLRFLRNASTNEITKNAIQYRMMEVANLHPEIAPKFPGEKK